MKGDQPEYVAAIHKAALQDLVLNIMLLTEARLLGKEAMTIQESQLAKTDTREVLAGSLRMMKADGYVARIKGDMVLLEDREASTPIHNQTHLPDFVITPAEMG